MSVCTYVRSYTYPSLVGWYLIYVWGICMVTMATACSHWTVVVEGYSEVILGDLIKRFLWSGQSAISTITSHLCVHDLSGCWVSLSLSLSLSLSSLSPSPSPSPPAHVHCSTSAEKQNNKSHESLASEDLHKIRWEINRTVLRQHLQGRYRVSVWFYKKKITFNLGIECILLTVWSTKYLLLLLYTHTVLVYQLFMTLFQLYPYTEEWFFLILKRLQ